MKISAKTDYAVRASAELAAVAPGVLVKGEHIARAQNIPLEFLENILRELRVAGLVVAQRGVEGGYGLARPAADITVAEVLDAIDSPLEGVAHVPLEELAYSGAATRLAEVWIAMRAGMRSVVDSVTLADLAAGELPASVLAVLAAADDAPLPS